MKDPSRIHPELIEEIFFLKQKIKKLEQSESDRKQAEENLKEREKTLQAFFDAVHESMVLIDTKGTILLSNAVGAQRLGKTLPEFVGTCLYDWFPPDIARHRKEQYEKVVDTGEPVYFQDTRLGRFFEQYCYPVFDEKRNISGVTIFAQEITSRKQAEESLQQTMEKLRKSLVGTIQAMSLTVETRDPYTAGHQRRVSTLARTIAQDMGLSKDTVENIRMAGIIHDIGKISVPAEILSRPGKLKDMEFSLIKAHSQTGYNILKDVGLTYPIAEIVLQHHERLDGSGYPQQLKGENILLEARILAVADVVEAIASHRPYRPGFGIDVALEEIEKNKGILYDAGVVEVCIKLFREKGFKFE